MSDSSFYVTLYSNAADNTRQNTPSQFSNVLHHPISVPRSEGWGVALYSLVCNNLFKRAIRYDGENNKYSNIPVESQVPLDQINVKCEQIKVPYDNRKWLSCHSRKDGDHSGQNVHAYEAEHLQYFPLDSDIVSVLDIELQDYKGRTLKYRRSQPTVCVLHFKRVMEGQYLPLWIGSENTRHVRNQANDFYATLPPLLNNRSDVKWQAAISSFTYVPHFKIVPKHMMLNKNNSLFDAYDMSDNNAPFARKINLADLKFPSGSTTKIGKAEWPRMSANPRKVISNDEASTGQAEGESAAAATESTSSDVVENETVRPAESASAAGVGVVEENVAEDKTSATNDVTEEIESEGLGVNTLPSLIGPPTEEEIAAAAALIAREQLEKADDVDNALLSDAGSEQVKRDIDLSSADLRDDSHEPMQILPEKINNLTNGQTLIHLLNLVLTFPQFYRRVDKSHPDYGKPLFQLTFTDIKKTRALLRFYFKSILYLPIYFAHILGFRDYATTTDNTLAVFAGNAGDVMVGRREINLRALQPQTLSLMCDFIEPAFVSGVMSPVIKTLPVTLSSKAELNSTTFSPHALEFHNLNTRELRELHFRLTDSSGQLIDFVNLKQNIAIGLVIKTY